MKPPRSSALIAAGLLVLAAVAGFAGWCEAQPTCCCDEPMSVAGCGMMACPAPEEQPTASPISTAPASNDDALSAPPTSNAVDSPETPALLAQAPRRVRSLPDRYLLDCTFRL